MNSDNREPNPDDASDLLPTCRWMENCELILEPDGCSTCDFMNPDLPRDEDGEPYDLPPDPLHLTR